MANSNHGCERPRTEISTSDPPLAPVGTAYPVPPFVPFFHPPVELPSSRPGGRLHVERWVGFSAIWCVPVLQVGIAEIHI
jgi:hypothetical protein